MIWLSRNFRIGDNLTATAFHDLFSESSGTMFPAFMRMKTMKFIPLSTALLALFLLAQSARGQVREIQLDWLKVHKPSKWIIPPKELELHERTGSAELIVLYPDGQFGYLACYLIQTDKGRLSISRGDGLVVGTGHWTRSGDRLSVDSRIVYRVVTMTGRSIPETWQTETFSTKRQGTLTRLKDNAIFSSLSNFTDLEFLAGVLSCDRRYWDGQKDTDGPQPCRIDSPTE